MLRCSTLPLLLSAAIASASANADQVTDQIAAGLRASEARVAMQALQFAVAEIEAQPRRKMMSSPMLIQVNPGSSPFVHRSYRGIIEQNEGGITKLSLMVGARILVQIEGEGGADRQTPDAYLQGLDLPNFEALLG